MVSTPSSMLQHSNKRCIICSDKFTTGLLPSTVTRLTLLKWPSLSCYVRDSIGRLNLAALTNLMSDEVTASVFTFFLPMHLWLSKYLPTFPWLGRTLDHRLLDRGPPANPTKHHSHSGRRIIEIRWLFYTPRCNSCDLIESIGLDQIHKEGILTLTESYLIRIRSLG